MSKLIENEELNNYLKNNYSKTEYRFKIMFGKMFPYKKFGQEEMDAISTLNIDSISSTAGIDELRNLQSLTLKDVPDLSDLEKLSNLRTFEYEINKCGVDTEKAITLSQNCFIEKVVMYGKSVKNISPEQAVQFGENASISYEYSHLAKITPKQFAEMQNRIAELKQLVTPEMTEIEKVKTIYANLLTEDFEFDYEGKNDMLTNKTEYGPLVKNKGVCNGIASALEATLESVGLEANACGGWLDSKPSAGNNHQWNQVKVDGQWYNLDLTNDYDIPSWRYFMKSDNDPDWAESHCREEAGGLEKFYPCISTKYDEIYREDPAQKEKRILNQHQKRLELEEQKKMELEKDKNSEYKTVDDNEER